MSVGCDDTTSILNPEDLAPALGLTSTTHDGAVLLQWQASNYGEDRTQFLIYRADGDLEGTAPSTVPSSFGTTPYATMNSTTDAGTFSYEVTGLVNGNTYSFLVVASKDNGNKISRPSNIVSDTPRQQSGVISMVNGGSTRYLDVSDDPPVPSSSLTGADIQCESFNAGLGDRAGMVGVNGARVQDLGWVSGWDQIDKAPEGLGSYPDALYSVQVLEGHVYAVFTADNHYAKIYISSLHVGDFGYDCQVAYQPQTGNNDLAPQMKPGG